MPTRVCSIVLVACFAVQEEKECPACKKKLKADAKFCGGCGKSLQEETPPKEKKKPKGIEGVGLTAEQVNKAIDRGAAYLLERAKGNQLEDREVMLAGLALLHAQAFDRDKAFRNKVVQYVTESDINRWATYDVGLMAMILDELGTNNLRLADCAKWFVENQAKDGSWAYGKAVPQLKADKPKRRLITVSGGVPIDEPGKPWIEIARENPEDFAQEGDNSTTQYALLGLRAAARRGIGIPKETWQKVYDETVTRFHERSGGWAYHNASTAYGSMTCAAGATLAIARHFIDGKSDEDPWVRKACDWMGKNFKTNEHPGYKGSWLGYYLYSVERLGMLAGEEFFGDHEWYPLGAKFLVGSQAGDGSWTLQDSNDPDLGTCFALLFLTRATPKLRVEIKRGGSGTLVTDSTMLGSYFHLILDCSGSMLKKLGGKTKFDIAVEALSAMLEEFPDNVGVGLRAYGNRKSAIEDGADTDSSLEIPIAKLDREKFRAKVRALRCRGKTPLAHSLKEAVADLQAVPAEADATVILLTDGMESTPGAKPEEAAAALAKARPKARLVVVGFDTNSNAEQKQLTGIADAAGGQVIFAADAESLAKGLVRGTKGSSDYVLFDRDGKEIAKGTFGDKRTLPEGKYAIEFEQKGKKVRQEIWVNTDATTRVVVDLFAE